MMRATWSSRHFWGFLSDSRKTLEYLRKDSQPRLKLSLHNRRYWERLGETRKSLQLIFVVLLFPSPRVFRALAPQNPASAWLSLKMTTFINGYFKTNFTF